MEYVSEIVSFIVGLVAGGASVTILKIRSSKRSMTTKTVMKNINATGSVAGRDIGK